LLTNCRLVVDLVLSAALGSKSRPPEASKGEREARNLEPP